MKTSCIDHPGKDRLVIIRKWQLEFCEGDHCAAALLSFFEYWHSWKLETDAYNHKTNDIAEMHGEARLLSEDIFQYHSLKELSSGILELYGEKTIAKSLKFLEEKSVITIHDNPNPRFHYDKRQYFIFYPEICNEWLKSSYKSRCGKNTTSGEQKYLLDEVKIQDASGKNILGHGKNALYRTEINNKDINQSIQSNERNAFFSHREESNLHSAEEKNISEEVHVIIENLKEKGFPASKFNYPDTMASIENLHLAGATLAMFLKAYDIALETTQSKGFGVNYLIRVVASILAKSNQQSQKTYENRKTPYHEKREPEYKNDFRNGLDWMGDLVEDFE